MTNPIRNLIVRAAAAMETPGDLTENAGIELINDLRAMETHIDEDRLVLAAPIKTVNLVFIGVQADDLPGDANSPIGGLVKELLARGGRIFLFGQKDQAAKDMQATHEALFDSMYRRHRESCYVVAHSASLSGSEAVRISNLVFAQISSLPDHNKEIIKVNPYSVEDDVSFIERVCQVLIERMNVKSPPAVSHDQRLLHNASVQLQSITQQLQCVVNVLEQVNGRSEQPQQSQMGFQRRNPTQGQYPSNKGFIPPFPDGLYRPSFGQSPQAMHAMSNFSGVVFIHAYNTQMANFAKDHILNLAEHIPQAKVVVVDYQDVPRENMTNYAHTRMVKEMAIPNGSRTATHFVLMDTSDQDNSALLAEGFKGEAITTALSRMPIRWFTMSKRALEDGGNALLIHHLTNAFDAIQRQF